MLKIIDGKIYMVRGDDDGINVVVMGADGEITLNADETLTLTVRELPDKGSPIIFQTTSAPGSNRVIIVNADTKDAEFGYYSADIQMMTSEGLRKTVWPVIDENNIPRPVVRNLKNFIILPEVTMI